MRLQLACRPLRSTGMLRKLLFLAMFTSGAYAYDTTQWRAFAVLCDAVDGVRQSLRWVSRCFVCGRTRYGCYCPNGEYTVAKHALGNTLLICCSHADTGNPFSESLTLDKRNHWFECNFLDDILIDFDLRAARLTSTDYTDAC